MKKFIYAIFAFAVLAFVGCTKEEIDDVTAQPGEAISFGVMTEGTRTVYGSQNTSDNTWPIYWTSTDQIRIFSAQAQSTQSTAAGVAYADYKVNGNNAASKATIAAVDTNKALKWNSEYGVQHTFYATYPGANGNITVDANGIATFPINRNQICDLDTSSDEATYVFKPRMENQYMVATAGENPKDLEKDAVWLDFKPVMTTLDIIVNGMEVVSDPNSTNDEPKKVRVTGVSIILDYADNKTLGETFDYNIGTGSIVMKDVAGTAEDGKYRNTFLVNLVNYESGDASSNYAVDLAPGESLKVTAFLPPLVNRKYSMKVRVHVAGSSEMYVTVANAEADTNGPVIVGTKTETNPETNLIPSSKAKFIMPAFPNPLPTRNNWITPLDSRIYVSQLSIPGSHDAATGEGMNLGIMDSFAATQELGIDDQWDLGVRCFDFRPAYYSLLGNSGELYIWHSGFRTKITWKNAMNKLISKLSTNSGEFAIVVFRHETETGIGKKTSAFISEMTAWVNENSSHLVTWKPNLTIGEARGKIILLSRESNLPAPCAYMYRWEDAQNSNGATISIMESHGSDTVGTLYLQDWYNSDSQDAKWTSILKYLNISKTFHTDEAKKNHWMINHASGYQGTGTTDGYVSNAKYQNNMLIQTISAESWSGSTGILIFDYPGASTSNGLINYGTEVQGDVALQTIIDNNYKYYMRRLGDE